MMMKLPSAMLATWAAISYQSFLYLGGFLVLRRI